MTEKRYSHDGVIIIDHLKKDLVYIEGKENLLEIAEYVDKLQEENEQLKQYKQSVNDVLRSWSQKNLTAKQLQVVLAIMEELNIIGDV